MYESYEVKTAPADLSRLIDASLAAETIAERISAHYNLLHWPGWRKRVTYTHRSVRIALIRGSLKIDNFTPLGGTNARETHI